MKIQLKLILGSFSNDVGFNKKTNSFFEKLAKEDSGFRYYLDPDNDNTFIIDTTVPITKKIIVPSFKNFVKDFAMGEEATEHYILREITTSFKLETSKVSFRQGDLDTFTEYVNSDTFNTL